MSLNAQELSIVRSVLVANKAIDATASDGDVAAAHAAALSGPNATEYKAQLTAQGVNVGPNWLKIAGWLGGAVALYFIWQNYQRTEVDARDYPEPSDNRHAIMGMSKALGSLRVGQKGCKTPLRRRGLGDTEPYEFEPEGRLEGYRRKKTGRK